MSPSLSRKNKKYWIPYQPNQMEEDGLVFKMKKLCFTHSAATRTADLLTWGQLKRLAAAADDVVTGAGKPKTPEVLFLALIALVQAQVLPINAQFDPNGEAYWTYFPNPPVLHPTTWSRTNIKVFTNKPQVLGGTSDSLIPHKIASTVTFYGITEETLMCFSTDNLHVPLGCLPLCYRTYNTDSPLEEENKKRDIWSLEIISLEYANHNDTNVSVTLPPSFKLCDDFNNQKDTAWNLIDVETDFPKWFECGFYHAAVQF